MQWTDSMVFIHTTKVLICMKLRTGTKVNLCSTKAVVFSSRIPINTLVSVKPTGKIS